MNKNIFKKNKVLSVRINTHVRELMEAQGITVQQLLDEAVTRFLIGGEGENDNTVNERDCEMSHKTK